MDTMDMAEKEMAVLDHVRQLTENVDALLEVLDGTWGMPKTEESQKDDVGTLTVEDRLDAIRIGVINAIERLQGIRNRLERHLRALA